MIPILYDALETSFTSEGLGRLADAISCVVRETRNDSFELEMVYPCSGAIYSEIQNGRIIAATHDIVGDVQYFVIYGRSSTIEGLTTIHAHHISYELSGAVLSPFSASDLTDLGAKFRGANMTPCRIDFEPQFASATAYETTVPVSAREVILGGEGSIIDVYGGELDYDGLTVYLKQARGADRGVYIRYAQNMTDIVSENDTLDQYFGVVPFWEDDGDVIYGNVVFGSGTPPRSTVNWADDNDEEIVNHQNTEIEFSFSTYAVVPLDLSDEFDSKPTRAQLETKAQAIINALIPWAEKNSITVSYADLERANGTGTTDIRLCDTIHIVCPLIGVNTTAQVIGTSFDVLADRYNSIEIGQPLWTYAEALGAIFQPRNSELAR